MKKREQEKAYMNEKAYILYITNNARYHRKIGNTQYSKYLMGLLIKWRWIRCYLNKHGEL